VVLQAPCHHQQPPPLLLLLPCVQRWAHLLLLQVPLLL
jgi:hypothetical protein